MRPACVCLCARCVNGLTMSAAINGPVKPIMSRVRWSECTLAHTRMYKPSRSVMPCLVQIYTDPRVRVRVRERHEVIRNDKNALEVFGALSSARTLTFNAFAFL